jgi:hypothetical protein
MENITSIFGLDADQTLLLYSLEYLIANDDIVESLTKKGKDGVKKNEWLASWAKGINLSLHSLGVRKKVLTQKSEVVSLYSQIKDKYNQNAWKYMILLECTLFTPYFPLGAEKDDIKKYKGLKPSKNIIKSSVNNICSILGTDLKYIDLFKDGYKSAIKKLSNYWSKVLFGSLIAAIVIIAIVFSFQYELAPLLAPGLYGAAAANAAFAMLGGGAIAAGGLGIVGGQLVVIGGGAILGTGLSNGIMALMGNSSDFTLSQLARLQVVLKEIIMGMQHDVLAIQQILLNQQEKINILKKEVIRLKADAKKNKDRIKNLEKSITYMERFMNANN